MKFIQPKDHHPDEVAMTTDTSDGDFNIRANGHIIAFIDSSTGKLSRLSFRPGGDARLELERAGFTFDAQDKIATNTR